MGLGTPLAISVLALFVPRPSCRQGGKIDPMSLHPLLHTMLVLQVLCEKMTQYRACTVCKRALVHAKFVLFCICKDGLSLPTIATSHYHLHPSKDPSKMVVNIVTYIKLH